MRLRLAAAACLAALLPMPVLANGMSLGHESLPPGSSVQACLQRGVAAIAQAGLRQLSTGTIATFGEGTASDGSVTIVSIYCVPSNGIVFIAGAADRYEEVNATITSIRNFFRVPQGPGPGQGPGMMQPPPGPGGFGPPQGLTPPGFGSPGLGGAPKQ